MSSEFQGLTFDDGRVKTTATIPADPADITIYRGFAVNPSGFVIVKVWDTIEPIYWNGAVAVSAEGYVLVNSGDPSNGRPMPGGMLVDDNGILFMSPSGSINIIHQGTGLESDAVLLSDDAGIVQFLEGGEPSVAIGIVTPGSCTYSTPDTDCVADGVYEAFTAEFEGAPISYLWSIEAGDATIIGSTTSKQVTVRTDGSADKTFDLKVVATSPQPESAERTQQFTHSHTNIPVKPAAPTTLIAVAHASLPQIQLTWVDNAVDETGYRVERGPSGAGPWSTIVSNLPPDTVAYLDTGLTPGETYFYRVFAFNAAGDSDPSNVDGDTVAAVVNVRVDVSGNTRVTADGDRRVV